MNKLTKYACILTTLAGAVACSGGKKAQGDYAIIPLPQEVVTQGSAPFLLKPSTPISYQEGDAEIPHRPGYYAIRTSHRHTTLLPSPIFCMPSTTFLLPAVS